ncbi:MAG: glycosyltransferase, partial [Planctomycetota bacterium]
MTIPVMKIGCILTTFPCRTETFVAREIEGLRDLGLDITVFAAARHECPRRYADNVNVLYRPSRFSAEAVCSIGYLLVRYPLGMGKLLYLAFKLLLACPREAALLMGNLHTIGFFSRHLRHEGISHIHAYFLSWPATIGLALSVVTGLTFSISAHARDIFVEHGAMEAKASRAKFIAVCTRQGLNHLKAAFASEDQPKLHLNYHGTKTNNIDCEIGEKNNEEVKKADTVFAAGRLISKKGYANLIKAFARVVGERPGCRLMIAGEGCERRRLEELIARLALEDHVRLLGWMGHDVMLQLVRQATVMVAPSVV